MPPLSTAQMAAAVDARMKARIAEVAEAMPGAPPAVVREACRADRELQALGAILIHLTEGEGRPGPGDTLH